MNSTVNINVATTANTAINNNNDNNNAPKKISLDSDGTKAS